MIYLLHSDASEESLTLKGEAYKYIIKARRHKVGDTLFLRSEDEIEMLYRYEISALESRSATLELQESMHKELKPNRYLHVGWCQIDFNSIDKVLAQLNEMGLSKITFIKCDRSQKSFKVDYKRIERVLRSSNMQCGRTDTIEFESADSIEEFIQAYPNATVLDFSDTLLENTQEIETVIIGCEGGFSPREKALLAQCSVMRFNSPLILRSESAITAITAKLLL